MPCSLGTIAAGIRVEPFETIMEYAPLVYYRMNESSGTITNSGSVASRNGTGTGITYAQPVIPTRSPGTSISFAGAGLISVTDGVIGGSSPQFSAGAWIKTTDAVSTMHILQQMDATNNNGGFRIYLVNGTSLRCEGKTTAGVVEFALTVNFADINDGVAMLIGMTVDTTHVYLYANGVYLGRSTRTGGTWSATSDIFIGGDSDGTDDFTGNISDAFITSQILDQWDWSKIYRRGMLNIVSPINDAWGSPIDISGLSGSQASVFTGASLDEDDIITSVGGSSAPNSTWLRYTASGTHYIKFDSTGTGNHAVQLFRQDGTLIGDMTFLDGYTALTTGSLSAYQMLDGEVYYLRVAGFQLATGTATVNWVETFPPANNDLANATTINTASASNVAGTNLDSTLEDPSETTATTGESNSTWYKFLAGSTGNITLDTELSDPADTTIGVWAGTASTVIGDLDFNTPYAFDDDSGVNFTSLVTFAVTSGTWYYVQISDYDGGGPHTLRWTTIT